MRRAFSLTDPSISFPYGPDTISVSTVFLAAVVAPAIIIAIVCLAFVSWPASDGAPPSPPLQWRRKLWELFTGLLGLAFSAVLSFFLTQSMKNLFGKPRPDFIDRCNPDVSRMPQYTVGGYSSELLEGTSVHVTWEICNSKDGGGVGKAEFDDGFRSFPSGHCTSERWTHNANYEHQGRALAAKQQRLRSTYSSSFLFLSGQPSTSPPPGTRTTSTTASTCSSVPSRAPSAPGSLSAVITCPSGVVRGGHGVRGATTGRSASQSEPARTINRNREVALRTREKPSRRMWREVVVCTIPTAGPMRSNWFRTPPSPLKARRASGISWGVRALEYCNGYHLL
ncbi:Phosphatidic acid phosphatase type 2/haloperoxidase [Macrophomina phaseolina MS6]|uniref:Phosphatidic acid phosphatase type 2/haloperoxidase n=1 Tax=Macrophomina phaseolina (strain MS6) TaxID=1126212 RepID=K2SNJ2_MACPH|nr:Phosphatidic acid phosphatase type 2/haloperoxidase [Macrophomina phaseolina MS6]